MGSSKKRVLIIIKGLGRGGAEQLLVSAAQYLDRERYDYHYAYVLAHKDALAGKLEDLGYPVHCLGEGAGPAWVARLAKLERNFDLVHVHSPVVAVAARLFRTKKTALVCTEHNVWGRYHRATYWANRLTFGRNDHVFAVSDEVRRSIHVPARRTGPTIETLYHGPDRAEIESWQGTDGVRAEFGIPTDAPLIGTVANFKDHKGYPFLIEAAAEVHRSVPDAHFMLVGQGPLEPAIKEQASALGLDGSITFTGFREDVPRLMGAFDLFTLASLHEGLSIALLEAMSLGKPPVVTGVGGHPEVVRPGQGFVVPPGDSPALADKLVALLKDDELRRRFGASARERANQFDISATVKRTEAVYQELLS
jgi:glycosyltransferase involved in cell wall biosynthesis